MNNKVSPTHLGQSRPIDQSLLRPTSAVLMRENTWRGMLKRFVVVIFCVMMSTKCARDEQNVGR